MPYLTSLEEAVRGITKEICVPTFEQCSFCQGKGCKLGTTPGKCSPCQGKGKIHLRQGFFTVQQTCPYCQGQGTIIKDPCLSCRGQGKIEKNKIISVKIPAGVDNEDRIRLSGKGSAGEGGSPSGDLYVQIAVKKHPIFERDKNNLYCEVPISFGMAALGGEIEVPTLGGRIKIKIPAETQTGKLFRMRGKGVKSLRGGFTGDLLCKIVVETPVNLNENQKRMLHELEKTLNYHSGEQNSPRSRTFFEGVKKFFDDLTR